MNRPSNANPSWAASLALRHAVAMNLVFVALVIIGGFVILKMPVDVYPDIDLDEATIDTVWLGASPEDIERLITDKIEEKIIDTRGVSKILSDSKPDASLIRVKFDETLSTAELDSAIRQLRADVEQVSDLPEGARKPVVTKISIGEVFFLIWVAVVDEGDVGEEVLHDIAIRLKTIIREIPGVGKVDDMLIRDREIHIKADQDSLRRFGLTLEDIGSILSRTNRSLPSGTLASKNELAIRAEGSVASPEELGDIVVAKNAQGGHVYLRDVAVISSAFARKTFFGRYDHQPCLSLGVTKKADADSRQVVRDSLNAIAAFNESLPDGVALRVFDDTSNMITDRLRVLTTNMSGGVVLVFFVLWVVVGLRNSLLAIVGIPFSFGCALICMHLLGVTISSVSLIGLVLCTGMIVDDAIVVLENIYRHVEQGGTDGEQRNRTINAIINGTGEVFWSVVSSSATTVAAFLPLLMMSGMTGKFFAIIPKTVAVVLLASLFECLLILPVHYLDFGFRAKKTRHADGNKRSKRLYQSIGRGLLSLYEKVLNVALPNRYLVPLPLLGLAFLTYSAMPLIDVVLFPTDRQHCLLDIQVSDEASLDRTGEIVRPIEEIALSMDGLVSGVATSVGLLITEDKAIKLRNNMAQLHVQLRKTNEFGGDRTLVAMELHDRIAEYLKQHPNCGIKSYRVGGGRDGPPAGKPVAILIETPDFASAKLLSEQFKARLRTMEGVLGVKDDLEFGQQQVNITLDDDRASVHGLTFMDLAGALRAANDGITVSSFKDKYSGEDLDVRLMLDQDDRRSVTDLLDVDIRTPANAVVQLGDIAELNVTQGYAAIPHLNGKRVVTVSAEIDSRKTTSQEVNATMKREFQGQLASARDVRVTFGGQYEEATSSFRSLKEAYVIAMLVVYLILATQFRSYAQPFVIISTVPFAGIGVFGGLWLSGYPFTTMTFIAIVGMSGVVVNDSILLVDCANQKRATGARLIEAVRAACLQRMRPVLLTTVTTVLGLAPLALGLGGTSPIWAPFASSFAWGLAFSTIVTMIVVPCVYCIANDAVEFLRRITKNEAVVAVNTASIDGTTLPPQAATLAGPTQQQTPTKPSSNVPGEHIAP